MASEIIAREIQDAGERQMLRGNWDRELLLTLNSIAGSDALDLWNFANSSLFRGFPVFFGLVALWFSGDCRERRSRMLAGLLAVCLASVFSVWLQFHLGTHLRPILDPALHLKVADPRWTLNWDREGSFPSDTATLFFALAAVIFLENRLVGLFCFLWVAIIIALPRVVFGWHYPSDIGGSLILGPGCVFIFNLIPYPRMLFDSALKSFEGRMYIVHALLFVFLTEAANLFESLQRAGKTLLRMLG